MSARPALLDQVHKHPNITISAHYADPNSAFGAAATIGGNPNNFGGGSFSQELFKAGAPLTTSTSCGSSHTKACAQQVYLRLTGSLPSSSEKLLNSDTTSLRVSHPPTGDGTSSATATGGGGGGIDVSEPSATVNIGPTLKAYVAAKTINIGGDLWIQTNGVTRSSAYTENGSGGLVSIPSVDSEIGGTDNNLAGIGDFSSVGSITGDTSSCPATCTAQVDASNMTLTVGGNVRIEALTSLNSSVDAKSDSGGGFDGSDATAHTDLTDNTAVAIGKNAKVDAGSVALNASTGGNNHAHAYSLVIALFGSSSASPKVTIKSRDTALFDGTPTSTGVITGMNGVDLRAHHESLKASADGGHLCICFDLHFGSDGSTDVKIFDTAAGHEGVTVVAGARIILCSGSPPAGPPTETTCSTRDPIWVVPWLVTKPDGTTADKYLGLFVQGEQHDSDGASNNLIRWHSDVVIYSRPSPLLSFITLSERSTSRLHTSRSVPEAGHGTACAGIITSIAPEVELYSVKVLGPNASGSGEMFLIFLIG